MKDQGPSRGRAGDECFEGHNTSETEIIYGYWEVRLAGTTLWRALNV